MTKGEAALRAIVALQNRIVASGLRLEAVMAVTVRELPLVLPQSSGAVIELRDGDYMVYRAGSGRAATCIGLRLAMDGSLSGKCATMMQPLYSRDTEEDDRVDKEACRRLKIRSMICYPLIAGDRCVGVCKSFATTPDAFSDADVETLGMVAAVIAASIQHAQLYQEVVDAGLVDKLTGLGNRRALDDELERALARARRSSEPLALAMIDLDEMKAINDSHGHVAGDDALANFGAALASGLRDGDRAFRLGGDEFCIIFARAAALNSTALLDRVRHAVSDIRIVDRPLSFSAGVAESAPGDRAAELLARADQAMYAQKRAGATRAAPPPR